jgi:Skp family chaperone for outer membrane proteins
MRRTWIYTALIFLTMLAAPIRLPAFAQSKESKDAPAPVTVPAPVIAVIDFQRVVRRSRAGRSVREQIDKQQAVFQIEVKKIQRELETARGELSERPANMTDAEFEAKRKAMRKRVAELQSLVQRRKRALDQVFNAGMRQVDLALVEVLKALAEEHGINLILNAGRGRGLVLFAENRIVITDEALRRLDERLPQVELTKPESAK